jgi:trk system potassium uptake protein TrkA
MAKIKDLVFTVVGLGAFGMKVCQVISERGGKVIAIDASEERINRVKNLVTQAVIMDATDEEGYKRLSLEDSDVGVVAIGDNVEGSILATALLKKAGVRYLVARAITPVHRQVLSQIGADEVINIEEDMGEQLAVKLIAPQILDLIPISERISMAEIYCPRDFVDKTLADLDLRGRVRLNVVAIKRDSVEVDELGNPHSSEELIFPQAEVVLKTNDILMVVGFNEDIETVKNF